MRRFAGLILGLALVAAACDGGGEAVSTTVGATTRPPPGSGVQAVAERFDPGSIQFVAALERFDGCDAVLDYFKTEALARVGPYGLGDGGGWWPGPVFAEDGAAREEAMAGAEAPATAMGATTTMAATAPAAGDGDYSGTNVQVAGVDEPDIVKTDGSRILAIVDRTLTYVDLTTGTPEVAGRLRFGDEEGWNHRLFMSGDRAFVFSDGSGWVGIPMPLIDTADSRIAPWSQGEVTLIHEVDLSDPADLRIVETLRIDGRFLSARAVGDTVRVVVSSYPGELPFVYPSGPSAEEFAEEANRTVIERSTLDDWLPGFTLFAGDQIAADGLLVDCARVHRPAEFAGFDTLSVLTLDIAAGLDGGDGTAVVAPGETVYASPESLYVATNVWVPTDVVGREDMEEFEESYSTAIHQFDISGDGPATYLASGSVDGHLLNQFSMDEYDGVLRVAVTDGPPWWSSDGSESLVVTLRRNGDRLERVGEVGGLGKGERIYSVRFMGETAYVVTFRQTDPLYVIDLRDPAAPTVSGELKIPGYSAYLHPLGEGRLLGVGRDATGDGRITGAKVSLFDVSDPADPREVDTWTLPGGSTDVEWDHLAFLAWAPLDMVVLPVQSWEEAFAGAVVLKTDGGLREFGRITHRPDGGTPSDCRDVVLPEEIRGEQMVVQVCGPDDAGGHPGYWCEEMPPEEVKYWSEEPVDIELGPDDRLEVCWPEYGWEDAPILRSLVVGEDLWTLSWRSLQANDLLTLDVRTRFPVG
jgi:uncharacterized secreted protein with C-terminal beta-propeller domain